MNCPYCNRLLSKNKFKNMYCSQLDHEFWINTEVASWYILHIETDLYIDKSILCQNNDHKYKNIMTFDNISPQQAAIHLKKIINLKSFL